MNRPARLFTALGAATVMVIGLGGGSVAYAASGAFGYTHTSDGKHRTISDPESGSCIDVDESAYQALNGTSSTVSLYKNSDCTGEELTLRPGKDDDTEYHFQSIQFGNS